MEVGGQRDAPAALSLGKNPGTDLIGGWVGSSGALDALEKVKTFPLPSTVSRTAQSVA